MRNIVETANEHLAKQSDDNAPAFTLEDANMEIDDHGEPVHKIPTFIKTNDFTWTFQQIVDTYGTPRYKEFNPAVFNIVTFPFLFGMMFGDVAHGLFLFIFGLYLLINNKAILSNENSMLKVFTKVRYLIPMMGFFSVFFGLLYNDFASISIPIGKSCFINDTKVDPETGRIYEYYGRKEENCEYYFGIDHKWNVGENDLTFLNSFKMKLSVIIGVFHMSLGIILKGFNCAFYNDWLGFFLEFVPQITFMTLIFGYMDFMIILKWLTPWIGKATFKAPNITSTLLNMFLKLGKVEGDPNDNVRKI